MTVKYLNYSGTDFCPLKPEIAPSSIGFRLNYLTKTLERHSTKELMSSTMAVKVRYKSLYISLPFSAKQQREMTLRLSSDLTKSTPK